MQAAPSGPALFADYDLARSFDVQRELAGFDVAVATMRWLCEDDSWIGSPFYVMDLVPGRVPPDRPPYHVGGWVYDGPEQDREIIWRAGIDAMAALHDVPVDGFSFLAEGDQGDAALQRIDRWRRFGEELGDDRDRSLLAALDKLEAQRPAPSPLVVHWVVTPKLGNMIFENGKAAAILDWELCGLSAREEDLAHWLAVDWFLSTGIGNPRLAALPRAEETISHYKAVSGQPTYGVEWWFAFRAPCEWDSSSSEQRCSRGCAAARRGRCVPTRSRPTSGIC